MDVKKLKETMWLEVQPRDEKVGVLKFKIRPMPLDFSVKLEDRENSEEVIDLVGELIEDWNLEDGGEKLPCTPENKKKYLRFVTRIKAKTLEDEPKVVLVGRRIVDFARDVENFLGN